MNPATLDHHIVLDAVYITISESGEEDADFDTLYVLPGVSFTESKSNPNRLLLNVDTTCCLHAPEDQQLTVLTELATTEIVVSLKVTGYMDLETATCNVELERITLVSPLSEPLAAKFARCKASEYSLNIQYATHHFTRRSFVYRS